MKAFSWQTLEYVHREKSSDWFWVVGIVAGAIALTAIIFGNLIFAILVAIGAFVLCLFAARKPQPIVVEILDKGVRIEHTLYPFRSLKSFSIDNAHHDGARLILRSERVMLPYITIPAPQNDEDIETLRAFLEPRLEEEPFEETPLHLFFERLWF